MASHKSCPITPYLSANPNSFRRHHHHHHLGLGSNEKNTRQTKNIIFNFSKIEIVMASSSGHPSSKSKSQLTKSKSKFNVDNSKFLNDLILHLNLIKSFNKLFFSLNRSQNNDLNQFFHISLFRFELWIGRIADHLPPNLFNFNNNNLSDSNFTHSIDLTLDFLPPLDVLFVWYTYCLRSRTYYEDSLRLYPILNYLKFPIKLAATQYTQFSSTQFDPNQLISCLPSHFNRMSGLNSINLWHSLTNTTFDPIQFNKNPTLRTCLCPKCDHTIETAFSTDSQDPSVTHNQIWSDPTDQCHLICQNCHWSGIKRDLGLFKFLRDLRSGLVITSTNYTHQSSHLVNHQVINCLAGTLTTNQNLRDDSNAIEFNRLMVQEALRSNKNELPNSVDIKLALEIFKSVAQSISIHSRCLDENQKREKRAAWERLLSSYSIPEPFSVDLIRAMKIEAWFIRKMVKLGWTDPDYTQSKQIQIPPSESNARKGLERCIARYQAFSELALTMKSSDVAIPTFDIDLAWKTDRIRGISYMESMIKDNKRMIDHPSDMGLDRSSVLAHFTMTAAMWFERYQIGYSRYPVPFPKVDRRKDWLRRILKESRASLTAAQLVETQSPSRKLNKQFQIEGKVIEQNKQLEIEKERVEECQVRVFKMNSLGECEDIHSKATQAAVLDTHQVALELSRLSKLSSPSPGLDEMARKKDVTLVVAKDKQTILSHTPEKKCATTQPRLQPSKDSLKVRFHPATTKAHMDQSPASRPPSQAMKESPEKLKKSRKSPSPLRSVSKSSETTLETGGQKVDRNINLDENTSIERPHRLPELPPKSAERRIDSKPILLKSAIKKEENWSNDDSTTTLGGDEAHSLISTFPRPVSLQSASTQDQIASKFIEIPIGKIAFVEDGNRLRCL
ncbi:hypothetical protein O181_010200 [Austropuccinia psidii MF-1]|uniref:Uncharacterized protein n=1 Tax=Austropuccinia psidii MF-1 TaxID=1389203 RepID=A0A9Q3GKN0_9BASI|nr:hypothetical protein [Austropuccinia psidii MF-1]